MRVWNSLDEVPTDLPRTVVTLGNFDGVHRGHREVLRRVVELARARGALAVAGGAARSLDDENGHMVQEKRHERHRRPSSFVYIT